MTNDRQTIIDALLLACDDITCLDASVKATPCRFHSLAVAFAKNDLLIVPSKNLRMLDKMMRAIVEQKVKQNDNTARNGGPGNAI